MRIRLPVRLLPLLAVGMLSACYTMRRYPPVPAPVLLASPSGFQMIQSSDSGTLPSICSARRASVEMTALHGDTLHFSRATILEQAPGTLPCAHAGAGLVLLGAHADLRSDVVRQNDGLTFAAILTAVPAMIGLLIFVFGRSAFTT